MAGTQGQTPLRTGGWHSGADLSEGRQRCVGQIQVLDPVSASASLKGGEKECWCQGNLRTEQREGGLSHGPDAHGPSPCLSFPREVPVAALRMRIFSVSPPCKSGSAVYKQSIRIFTNLGLENFPWVWAPVQMFSGAGALRRAAANKQAD